MKASNYIFTGFYRITYVIVNPSTSPNETVLLMIVNECYNENKFPTTLKNVYRLFIVKTFEQVDVYSTFLNKNKFYLACKLDTNEVPVRLIFN